MTPFRPLPVAVPRPASADASRPADHSGGGPPAPPATAGPPAPPAVTAAGTSQAATTVAAEPPPSKLLAAAISHNGSDPYIVPACVSVMAAGAGISASDLFTCRPGTSSVGCRDGSHPRVVALLSATRVSRLLWRVTTASHPYVPLAPPVLVCPIHLCYQMHGAPLQRELLPRGESWRR